MFDLAEDAESDEQLKMVRKIISGGQTGADRAGLDFAIHASLENGGYIPRGRKAEDGRIDDRYNLGELSTSSYPARTRRNIEESDGTVIFSLNRRRRGGTKLTLELANKLGKPVLHIYDTRKERIIQPRLALPRDSSPEGFRVLKEDRNPERGRSSRIEGARHLRLDAEDVAPFC
jgi:Circularly permutated YpsA SLOG family